MASVAPMKRESPSRRIRNRVNTAQSDDVIGNEVATDDVDDESIFDSLSPLLVTMRLFGLYFKRQSGKRPEMSLSDDNCGADELSRRHAGRQTNVDTLTMIWCFTVVIILWLSVAMSFMSFAHNDKAITSILVKLVMVINFTQSSIQQTTFLIGCYKGRFDQVLCGMRFDSKARYAQTRRVAILITCLGWASFFANAGALSYMSFFTSYAEIVLMPFGAAEATAKITIQVIKGIAIVMLSSAWVFTVAIIKAIAIVMFSLAWVFTVAFVLMMCIVFSVQFRDVDKKLSKLSKRSDGISDDTMNDIKDRHQSLCQSVKRADRFLSIFFLAALICPIAVVICDVYAVIWSSSAFENNATALFVAAYLTMGYAIQFFVTSASGTAVNHYAHSIRDSLLNVKLSGLSSETLGKVNVLLNRTSGEPIGFTMVNLMTVDRTAIISLLGLLVTYFLLVLQFSPSSNSTASVNVTATT